MLDNIEITEEEIKDVIVNSDPNRARSSNMISNKMIIKIAAAITKPLYVIFIRSLYEGIFPDIWKLGNTVLYHYLKKEEIFTSKQSSSFAFKQFR